MEHSFYYLNRFANTFFMIPRQTQHFYKLSDYEKSLDIKSVFIKMRFIKMLCLPRDHENEFFNDHEKVTPGGPVDGSGLPNRRLHAWIWL